MTASELMERLNAVVSEYGDMPVVHEGDGILSDPMLHFSFSAFGDATLVITGSAMYNENKD